MTKSVTKIQDKDTKRRLSVVRSTEDPTKYGVVILNPDGSRIRGPKGDKGDKGDTGEINVGKTTTGEPGTNASVVNSGTSTDAVLDFTIPRGDKGETGNAATVNVGSTTTGSAGTCACVVNSGDCHNAVLNFTIPKGDKGDTGDDACVSVGTTCTGNPGTEANVENVGTPGNAVLNFTIPQGVQGEKGDAATISVGTTTTGSAGSCACVSNSGTSSAAVFDFKIPKGDKGDTGEAATINVGTTSTLAPGCCATVSNSGTTGAAIFNFGIPKGEKGDKGDKGNTGNAATVSAGTTTTLCAGCSANVTNSGTSSAAVFNFEIPKGDKGDKGDTGNAATISVGTTTTLDAGCNATVSNSGTSGAAVFNFGIPKGDKGDQGIQGETGPTGNGICCVTCDKVGKVTTVTIFETNGSCCAFCVCDGNDGEGSGDVLGPSTSVNNHVAVFDGTSGKLIKDSGKTLPNVVDSLSCTSTTDALSANQGKELKDLIDTYVGLGRFLSLWNASTGMPISFPLTTPYTYKTGDWFMVEVVGTTNYKPDGSSYTGSASTTVDSVNNVEVRDVYIYDGTDWLFQKNNETQVSFSDIAGVPSDNVCLGAVLNSKANSSSLCAVSTSGKYCDLTGQPTKVSCFENDCGYTTCTGTLVASDLTPYAKSCDVIKCKSTTGSQTVCTTASGCTTAFGVKSNATSSYISFNNCNGWLASIGATNNKKPSWYDGIGHTLAFTEDIPTDNCQLGNSCGYITSSDLSSYAKCCDIPTDNCQLANSCGYITGINCTAVTNALGYTPYNGNTNPNGYITISSVPTDNCELSNGCGYITSSALSGYAKCCDVPTDNCQLANSCGYTTCTGTLVASDLNCYAKCCDIPTNNSQLSNGCGYITSSSLPGIASSSVAGIVKLGSNTVQSCTMAGVSCVANRTYGVQLNSSCQMVVNIPWENTQCVTSVNGCTGDVNLSIPTVSDVAFGSSWDGNLDAPSKNAIYDKVNSIKEVPSGGTEGQVLTQTAGGTPDWEDPKGGASGKYVDVLIVGGGGAGGSNLTSGTAGGGGGGGGEVIQLFKTPISDTTDITIGAGGVGVAKCGGGNGGDTTFGEIIASGGCGGNVGYFACQCNLCGKGGMSGSGCEGGYCYSSTQFCQCTGSGGGGASSIGLMKFRYQGNFSCVECQMSYGGAGGFGVQSIFEGTRKGYGGGGGGSTSGSCGNALNGYGYDGGGRGNQNATYYGGGGGGVKCCNCPGCAGCQGVVIVRYPLSDGYGGTNAIGGEMSLKKVGGKWYKIHKFTEDGTLTLTNEPLPTILPGIYLNSACCLITMSSDGYNWLTMRDRNLGATSNNISSSNSYGCLYQWGNNYGFPNTGTVSTTTKIATGMDAYGPGNYYCCNVFVKGCFYWSTPENLNLWGGETDTYIARQGPAGNGYHVPSKADIQCMLDLFCELKGSGASCGDLKTYFCFPLVSYRSCGGAIQSGCTCYQTWTSDGASSCCHCASALYRTTADCSRIGCYFRSYGFPIRPFKNEGVKPDDTWTKLL